MRRRFLYGKENTSFNYLDYFTIEVLSDTASIYPYRKVYYSINGQDWLMTNPDLENKRTITAYKGDFVSLSCVLDVGEAFGKMQIKGSFNLRGNSLSLIFGDDAKNKTDISAYPNVFDSLFLMNHNLYNVDKDFLPATTLAAHCYNQMFTSCSNLITAPDLPATTLVEGCYMELFRGCGKINRVKAMFTNAPSEKYTNYWLTQTASTGTFVKNKNATWNVTGVYGVPRGWTIIKE